MHVIAGWLYASGFHSQALAIQEPSRTFGVWVRQVDTKRIILEAKFPRQDIGHPGTLGLYWDHGYGQLGNVLDVTDNRITRSFSLLEGSLPNSCTEPELSACPPVDIENYAFPGDPSDRMLHFTEINFDSPLGTFGAWETPANSSDSWAIHVHGWTADRRETIRTLPAFHGAGFTSLSIDYRNDPDSLADPTGRYRFGISEWEEVEGAVKYAVARGAERIVLVGYSTGAALVMSFLEQSKLTNEVAAVVLDSPNIILVDAVRANTRDAAFPAIGVKMTRLMKEFGLWIADLRWKVDWEKTNYVQRAHHILTVPTLVFHGTSDQRVPIDVSRQLEARVPGYVTLIETQAAGHVMSWNANPCRYEEQIENFLKGL